MMRSEFIERTGFEPTNDEYAEIEQEYMGCDIDKDLFCKQWKKNGGIQRLMRLRARRIEELEDQIKTKDAEYERMDNQHASDFLRCRDEWKQKNESLEQLLSRTKEANENLCKLLTESNAAKAGAERKLAVLKEAFAILKEEREAE